MDFRDKPIYSLLPWVISVFVSLLVALFMRNELAHHEKDWQEHLRIQQVAGEAELKMSQQHLLHQAIGFAQLITQNEKVLALVRRAADLYRQEDGDDSVEHSADVREQLYQTLEPYWHQMVPLGVREINIHTGAHAVMFLRMNNKLRFGDRNSQLKPLIMSVVKKGIAESGMEIGHFGANYRGYVPIFQSTTSSEVIAVIEVAIALLPSQDMNIEQGKAVLISATLTNQMLWDSAKQSVMANSKNRVSPWYLESYTHPIAKTWQEGGVFSDLVFDRFAPKIVQEQDKTYLLGVTPLGGLAVPETTALAPQLLMLKWTDITKDVEANTARRYSILRNSAVLWLVSLALLWFLFRFNRINVIQLLREHSKQLQTERDLSDQARQRLTLALVSSESGFWEWNIATNKVIFSKEWRDLCGLPGNDGGADVEEWLMRVHPSDKRVSYSEMIRHVKGETPMFENEYRLRVSDGSYKWIFTRGKVVEWGADGKATLMLGVYSDITNRKANEITVIRQQSALSALTEIASLPMLDADTQLRSALEVGGRFLGLPHGVLSEVQGNQYQIKVELNKGGTTEEITPLSNHFCELAISNKDVFCCDEITQSEYTNHYAYQRQKVETYIGVPVYVHGDIFGTLSFDSERSRHQEYDDLDKDFLRLFARWMGVTLERWQYFSEQQNTIKKFETLCNQLPGFLYQFQLNKDGTSLFPFSSSGIDNIYGVSPEDVVTDASKVFSVLHPSDLGWVSQSISSSAATLKDWRASYRVNHPQRGEIWVRGEARPERLKDGSTLWNGYIHDVTDEKTAAIKLQDINAMREAIFDAARIAIISTDPNGLIKTFNRGAEDLLGYFAVEVIDRMTPSPFHVAEEVVARAKILSQEFGVEVEPGFDVFVIKSREGDNEENEWTYVRKDGTKIPVLLSVSTLRSQDGEITGYLGLARDISEIKRIDRLKTEFISTVSHELRTPLTAISGALGIIASGATGALPDTASKMLNIAHKNSLRLIHLVNDLLDMEKLVAGKMNFDLKLQPLIPIVSQSIEDNAAYASQFSVVIELNNLARDDVRLNVDAQRLQQVLANFISNAAKFSPANESIEVRIERLMKRIRVSVIDKGPGIPEDFRDRIFQKFSQADSSDTRQKGGTGLGLAICKEIIERMGGKIGFVSEEGHGSQFYFDFPLENYVAVTEQKVLSGERILVVEDDVEIAELFVTVLRTKGYRVDVADSGQSALERLALYSYQAITMDLELPDINGIDLIDQLRRDSSFKNIPIIVISANLDSELPKASFYENVLWLQKPQSTTAIVDAITKSISQRGLVNES